MKKFVIFNFLMLSFLFPGLGLCKDLSSAYMIGIRFGFWNAVKAKNIESFSDQEITSKVAAPYGEFYISSGLKKGFAIELSLGSCYRGETRYHDSYGYYWKRINIYPFSVQLKFYPLSTIKKSRWQPYTDVGVAFVSGVEDLRVGEYVGPSILTEDLTNTFSTFGWHAGLGLDFILSRLIVLGVDFKYRGVNFNDKIGGLKDYSGPQATLGLSYILKGI